MAGEAGKSVLLIGATEFLGRTLLRFLFREGWRVFALTHPDERPAIEAMRSKLSRENSDSGGSICVLLGDSTQPGVGLDSRTIDSICREIRYVVHCPPLALRGRDLFQRTIDSIIKGTDQVISLAHRFPKLKVLAHISTVFISGNYPGRFYEDWLDVGQSFYEPIGRSHFIAEVKLRNASRTIPIVVLRCGYLIGDAATGECDDRHGLSPLFKVVIKYAGVVPKLLPLLFPDSEEMILSFSPNDYCAKALLGIATEKDSQGKTFCLVDPSAPSLRAFVDILSDLLERTCYRIPLDTIKKVPLWEPMYAVEWTGMLAEKLKISSFPLRFLFQRGDFDVTNTRQVLVQGSVSCPPYTEYLERFYRFYVTRYI